MYSIRKYWSAFLEKLDNTTFVNCLLMMNLAAFVRKSLVLQTLSTLLRNSRTTNLLVMKLTQNYPFILAMFNV